jgi:hypothetical protein
VAESITSEPSLEAIACDAGSAVHPRGSVIVTLPLGV